MRTPLSPAITLMNRLSFPRKFALIGLFFALPLGLVVYFLFGEMNNGIKFASKEVLGTEYLRPVMRLVGSLQTHRGRSYTLALTGNDAKELDAIVAQIDEDIRAVDAADRKLGGVLRTTDQWTAIKGKCRLMLSGSSAKSPSVQFDHKTALIAEVIALMAQAGDQSNLILDPDLDTYYLMETVVNRLVMLSESIGQARALSPAEATSQSDSQFERLRLSNLASLIRTTQSSLTRNFNVVFRETHDPKLESQLEPALKKSIAATTEFLESLDRRTMTGLEQRPDEYWTQGTAALQANYNLYDQSADALDKLLHARIQRFIWSKQIVAAVTLPCVLTALYLFVAFYRAVMGTVLKLEDASQRMLRGEMDNIEPPLDSRDELAHVTRAFGALTKRLRSDYAALKENEERTRLIIDSALDAVITMDANGRITGWNAQSEATFGWGCDEVFGRMLAEVIIPPQFRDAHQRGIQRFLTTGEGVVLNRRIEVPALHRDGREFPVEVAVTPAKSGETYIFSAFLRDITTRKQAETELQNAKATAEAANRAKSDFLANMSHEIRTPMNGILGMTELALDTELSREQREYLELVKYSADSLLTVINDILDFSKIEAGKLLLDPIPFDLADCVADTMKTLGVRAHQKGLELILHVHPDVPASVVGDMARVRQVLVNLVGNALKFTEQGEVLVRVEPESQTENEVVLHFRVSDTGIGIPQEKVKTIFQAFEQADGSITRKYGGTGLGLSISSQLIGLMGGRIWVESEVGRGSTFHFKVRFDVHSASLPQPARTNLDSLKNLPVLIVDDNATNRRILELVTVNWRMKPTLADSGSEALQLLDLALERDEPFGLVLLDAQMPGMDGFTLAENIKRRVEMSRATIMMLSSAAQLGDAQRCREMGLAAYLTKPIKQSELLDAILLTFDYSSEPIGHPIASPGLQAATHAREGAHWHVLLAEDNLVNQRVAVRMLERMGHSVVVVSNGKEALAALDRERFDLLLSDVQMPQMDGLEATRAIRQREQTTGEHLPIIAMTAHAMKGDREQCLDAGMDAYASKPIQTKELADTIKEVMARFGRELLDDVPTNAAPATTRVENDSGQLSSADDPPSQGETLDIVDMKSLLDRLGGDPDLLIEIVGIYLEDGPRLLEEMRAAIARHDSRSLASAAHQYKGTVLNLSAEPVAAVAAHLENIGRSSNLEGVDEVLTQLEQQAAALESVLTRFEPAGVGP